MKHLPYILLALAALALAGCNGTTVFLGASALGMYATKDDYPPADTEHQIAQHESWCYETMGYAECYASPQPGQGSRLINVDPANKYPLTPRAYDDAVVEGQ